MERIITYSPAYTIVPTYECFNRCSYCNFRVDIGKGNLLTIDAAKRELASLSDSQIAEILILSGEVHPLSPQRKLWFNRIYQLCELALALGFLPHTNVGLLSWSEMKQLKQPELRLQQLEWAGKLKIPFTTGLLLGIGETKADRQASLQAIANIQAQWGNIQEVILQPYSLGSQQQLNQVSFNLQELPEIIAQARTILPETIAIQIPPNLILETNLLLDCLHAGATDLGGISPKDEVNPDYPHLTAKSLEKIIEPAGCQLIPRLPVYPQYYDWLPLKLQTVVKAKENTWRYRRVIDRVLN